MKHRLRSDAAERPRPEARERRSTRRETAARPPGAGCSSRGTSGDRIDRAGNVAVEDVVGRGTLAERRPSSWPHAVSS